MFPASIFEPQWLGGNQTCCLKKVFKVLFFILLWDCNIFLYLILKGNILLTNYLTCDQFIVHYDILRLVNLKLL